MRSSQRIREAVAWHALQHARQHLATCLHRQLAERQLPRPSCEQVERGELRTPRRRRVRRQVADLRVAVAVHLLGNRIVSVGPRDERLDRRLLPLLAEFWQIVCSRLDARSRAGRLKQWLNFLRRRFPEAETAYQQLRTINDPALIDGWLAGVVSAHASSPDGQQVAMLAAA